MKPVPLLSDLVGYRNRLDHLELDSVAARLLHNLDAVVHMATQDPAVRFKKNNSRVLAAHQDLITGLENFCGAITHLTQSVDDLIAQQQQPYYERSWRLFDQDMLYETPDYILSRQLSIEAQDRQILSARLLSYSDWRIPGLILRPGRTSWIDHLVALDPLYVADHHADLLSPAVEKFPPEYQRRMRPYVITDRSSDEIFKPLPNEQFGYVFAYNFFNFKPIELVERYLVEIWHKLRSGGTVLFTFNDCDWAHNVALAEKNYMCYTPGSRVIELARSQGYEILDHYRGGGDCAWLELKRPGKMRSMRGAQTLAKIIPRSK
jgi:hypothetical protein